MQMSCILLHYSKTLKVYLQIKWPITNMSLCLYIKYIYLQSALIHIYCTSFVTSAVSTHTSSCPLTVESRWKARINSIPNSISVHVWNVLHFPFTDWKCEQMGPSVRLLTKKMRGIQKVVEQTFLLGNVPLHTVDPIMSFV